MDAFFNALKAKFQKGGTVKRPTGAKTGEIPEGKGMKPDGAPKPMNRKKYDKYKDGKKRPIKPADDEQKTKVKEESKKKFPAGIGNTGPKATQTGTRKKMRYGGSKKKMY